MMFELDEPVGGDVDDREITTYTYDSDGNLAEAVFENDYPTDGVTDSRVTTTYTYAACEG